MLTSEWPTREAPSAGLFVARQVDFLRQAGVAVDVIHFRGARNASNYVRAWRIVHRRLAGARYDLVHAQWGQSALLALPSRVPLVITFRGADLEGIVGANGKYTLAGRVLAFVSKGVASRADRVIVVSERLARHIPDLPYEVIPSGLDLELFRPLAQAEARRQLGLPKDKHLVLFAASPARPVKRYNLAQAAVARLAESINAQLVVTNNVPHELMPIYMNACNVLLLTSSHEGSPNVVKEALACNLPVVSVNVGDVLERLAPVEGCIVCDDDRPATIAGALELVLRRGQRLDARRSVRDLAERVLTEKVLSAYRDAVSRRST